VFQGSMQYTKGRGERSGVFKELSNHHQGRSRVFWGSILGCALVFASEAKIEIEAKISFRLEAKKKHVFVCFTSKRNSKNLKRKRT
jgi:hypothetical protein